MPEPTEPEYLTVKDVARHLKISENTALRIFSSVPGVIDLSARERRRGRPYRQLRIPRGVLSRFLEERRKR